MIDLVGVPTNAPVVITIAFASDAGVINTAMNTGAPGLLMRAVYAHANMDLDRSNPDSNSPGPAFLSQLSSIGVALEKLADPSDPGPGGVFGAEVAKIPALLANTTAELAKSKSKRVPYTLDLLTL